MDATMLRENRVLSVRVPDRVFDTPRVIFTLDGNPQSQRVIGELQQLLPQGDNAPDVRVFETERAVRTFFEGGVSPLAGVALFDSAIGGHFHPTTHMGRPDDAKRIPGWTCGVPWVVMVSDRIANHAGCARQVKSDFHEKFRERLGATMKHSGGTYEMFPWGSGRSGERAPKAVQLPDNMADIEARLNAGPDLKAAIADQAFAAELPTHSKISWVRVAPEPVECDGDTLRAILNAFQAFEVACDQLARRDSHVCELLLAGVDLEPGSDVAEMYLHPRSDHFSVRRPDLHYTGTGLFSSENDEMPGGWPELYHIDRAYGINTERWKRCFEWLTSEGPLLFVVSHDWSKCYIPETEWLAYELLLQGYPVRIITTDHLDEVSITDAGVFHSGERVGTIWRQFPIFETRGRVADLVSAAYAGVVRMVPEFAHFGNKAWFSIFRSHIETFRQILPKDVFEILETILPDSRLILSPKDFPCGIAGFEFPNLAALRELPEEGRNHLVLKISGANPKTARSYGVLMGHGIKQDEWYRWIDERIAQREPFIIQHRLPTGVARVPVMNTSSRAPELFSCRVLLRPWTVGGELVSIAGIGVPSNTLRVHGRVDMVVLPVRFD